MKRVRRVVFWCHLFAGVTAGVVVLIMSVTGALLAFQPQVLAFVERDARSVSVPGQADARLGAQEILARAVEARPDLKPSGLTIQADPSVAASVTLGREGNIYLNQYTGELLGESSTGWRKFFRSVEDWHRWLGVSGDGRATAKAVTGACNAAFLMLAVTGVFIWWPKKWNWQQVSQVVLFKRGLAGRSRDFNWHNVTGVWCASVLVLLTATGLVMSYQWANNLLYRLSGSEPPQPLTVSRSSSEASRDQQRRETSQRPSSEPGGAGLPVSLNQMWLLAEQQAPGWQSISLRLPQRTGDPVVFAIDEGKSWNPIARSQLTFDSATAEIVKWEPYEGLSAGRQLRSWVRSTHTGESGRLPGQIIAFIASLGGGLLVWTGLSLALRHFRGWLARRANQAVRMGAATAQGVTDSGAQ